MPTNNAINSTFPVQPVRPVDGGTGVSSPTAKTIPIAQGASNFTFIGPLTDGQLPIGSTGLDPVPNTLTAGTGISITNGAGTITIASTGSDFPTIEVTGTTVSFVINTRYIMNNVALVTGTIPTTFALGDVIKVVGKGSGGWLVAQNASQTIHAGNVNTTTGTGGSLASTNRYDSLNLVGITANTEMSLEGGPQGNITVV